MKVANAVAIVTGGASGFGKAFCKSLLSQGAKVVIADVNVPAGQEFAQECAKQYGEGNSKFMQCDVSNSEQLQNLLKSSKEHFGGLDIVCNNAGIFNRDEKMARKMVEINLTAVIEGTFLALEAMKTENGGRGGVIINSASAAGLVEMPGAPVYTATKHGVVGFTRAFAHSELENIRVNCICPFFVATPMYDQAAYDEKLKGKIGLHGLATIEDVVLALNKIISDDKLNGSAIAVMPQNKVFEVQFNKPKPKL